MGQKWKQIYFFIRQGHAVKKNLKSVPTSKARRDMDIEGHEEHGGYRLEYVGI